MRNKGIPKYDFSNVNKVHEKFFVERVATADQLERALLSGACCMIVGLPRVGKSALIETFGERFQRAHKDYRWLGYSFKGEDFTFAEGDLAGQLRKKIGANKDANKKTIVILDEFNACLDILGEHDLMLVDIANVLNQLQAEGCQFVVVVQDKYKPPELFQRCPKLKSIFPYALECIEVQPFNKDEFRQFCAHSQVNVQKLIEELFAVTKGIVFRAAIYLWGVNILARLNKRHNSISDLDAFPPVKDKLRDLERTFEVMREISGDSDEKRHRQGAGGRSNLSPGRVTDHVFISEDQKILRVDRAPNKKYRLTNQRVWDIVDDMLKTAKGSAKERYIAFCGKDKILFRKGDARIFLEECVQIEKAKRTIARARFKEALL